MMHKNGVMSGVRLRLDGGEEDEASGDAGVTAASADQMYSLPSTRSASQPVMQSFSTSQGEGCLPSTLGIDLGNIHEVNAIDDQELKLALGQIDTQWGITNQDDDDDESMSDDSDNASDEIASDDNDDSDCIMLDTPLSQAMQVAKPAGKAQPSVRSYMRKPSRKRRKRYRFKEIASSSFVKRHGEEENPEDLPYLVEAGRFTCKLCGAYFLGRRSLALHMQSTHNMSINKKFNLAGNEVRSLITHPTASISPLNEIKFICKLCDPPSTYSSQRGLLQHTRKVHPHSTLNPQVAAPARPPLNAFKVDAGDGGVAKIRFKCWHCSVSFATLSARMAHLQQDHTVNGAKPLEEFPCEICGFKTQNMVAYSNHTQIHDVSGLGLTSYNNEIQEFSKDTGEFKPVEAEKPEVTTTTIKTETVMTTVAATTVATPTTTQDGLHLPRSYLCPECGSEFTQLQQFHIHCKMLHPTAAIHMCRFCCQLQGSAAELEKHENNHFAKTQNPTSPSQGRTPQICNSSYPPQTYNSETHMKENHLQIKQEQEENAYASNLNHMMNYPAAMQNANQNYPPGPNHFSAHEPAPYAQMSFNHQGQNYGYGHSQSIVNHGMTMNHSQGHYSQMTMNNRPPYMQNVGQNHNTHNYGYSAGYNTGPNNATFGPNNSNFGPNNANFDSNNATFGPNNANQHMNNTQPNFNSVLSQNHSTQNSTVCMQQNLYNNEQTVKTEQGPIKTEPSETCRQNYDRNSDLMTNDKSNSSQNDENESLEVKSELQGPFECHLCDEIFVTKQHYDNHMDYEFLSQPKKVRGQSGPPYPCCECFKLKYEMPQLIGHVELAHPMISFKLGILCTICLKICDEKVYQMHAEIHRKDKMQCVFCKKVFVSKLAFDGHMKVELARISADTVRKVLPPPQLPAPITNAQNEILCPNCDMRFISKQSYNRHKCGNRRAESKIFCRLCGMRFERHKELRQHKCEDSVNKCLNCGKKNEANHKCIILKQCQHCAMKFASDAHYYQHIKNIHSQAEAPANDVDNELISCNACKRVFATFQERSKHILTEHISGKKKQPTPAPLSFLPPSMFMNNGKN